MQDKVELMYRPPGGNKHKNITEVLDELILLTRRQDDRILELEEQVEQLLLLIN